MSKKSNKVINNEVTDIDVELSKLDGKSSKIRYLDSLGWTRKQIVEKISSLYGKEVRYQHVRNVLVTQLKKDMTK